MLSWIKNGSVSDQSLCHDPHNRYFNSRKDLFTLMRIPLQLSPESDIPVPEKSPFAVTAVDIPALVAMFLSIEENSGLSQFFWKVISPYHLFYHPPCFFHCNIFSIILLIQQYSQSTPSWEATSRCSLHHVGIFPLLQQHPPQAERNTNRKDK